jgi:hypothetical protein
MIRKLLEWILGIEFSLCKHDFVLQETINIFNPDSSGRYNEHPQKIKFLYFCKKCGKQKITVIK